MADKALYILAGYDAETEAHLSAIQSQLYAQGFTGTHTKGIPQHITLGSHPVEKEEELIDLLHQLSKTIESFDVTFNHVGIFGGSRVLFIAPDASHELLSLKENFGSSHGWTPHTTMLIDEKEIILKALPIAMNTFSSFSGKVTTLHLYEFWPTRHILTVLLTEAE
ncbi:MAG: 2'-5' RNA ligase family protein [Clostridia bacterium]|nr:2'-5' RNA ligase family protein [Clostridia bacterium]